MKIQSKILYWFIVLCCNLTACQLGDWHYVDFTDIPSSEGMFRVLSQRNTDMQKLAEDPNQLALWGIYSNEDTTDNSNSFS
mgnify:FL=1